MTESDRLFYALGKQVCAAAEELSKACTLAEYQGGLRVVIGMLEMDWRASIRKAAGVPKVGRP